MLVEIVVYTVSFGIGAVGMHIWLNRAAIRRAFHYCGLRCVLRPETCPYVDQEKLERLNARRGKPKMVEATLVGGPQDGARVCGAKGLPLKVYVAKVNKGDGFAAWSTEPCGRFPVLYQDNFHGRFVFQGYVPQMDWASEGG